MLSQARLTGGSMENIADVFTVWYNQDICLVYTLFNKTIFIITSVY